MTALRRKVRRAAMLLALALVAGCEGPPTPTTGAPAVAVWNGHDWRMTTALVNSLRAELAATRDSLRREHAQIEYVRATRDSALNLAERSGAQVDRLLRLLK